MVLIGPVNFQGQSFQDSNMTAQKITKSLRMQVTLKHSEKLPAKLLFPFAPSAEEGKGGLDYI